VEEADAELVAAAEALQRCEAGMVDARGRQERAKAFQAAQSRLLVIVGKLNDLTVRRMNNERLLSDAEAIRAAVARRDDLVSQLPGLECEAEDARDAAVRLEHAAVSNEHNVRRTEERLSGLRARRDVVRLTASKRAEIESARALLLTERSGIAEAEARLAGLRAQLDELRTEIAQRAAGRIGTLRCHLEKIVSSVRADSKARARAALTEDDEIAKLVTDGPAEVAERREAIAALEKWIAAHRHTLAVAERNAASWDAVLEAEREFQSLDGQIDDLAESHVELVRSAASARQMANGAAAVRAKLEQRLAAVKGEIEQLAKPASRVVVLETAAARIAELAPQIAALEAEDAELSAIPEEDTEVDHVGAAEAALAVARAALGRAEQSVLVARRDRERRDALQAELAAAELDLSDWVRLGNDLGRDGLQASLIDCAGPELTEMVNDLLHTCVGPRWTIAIEASKTSADGKRELSGMEVRVLDTQSGREAGAETFSGGEQVLLQEAISLALTMLACRRAGATQPTLIRDETGAALSPENARAWVAMMRRAADLIGADKVLYVSHSPECQELADARIVVEDGKVTVQ
jgi:exonuclease SbcC